MPLRSTLTGLAKLAFHHGGLARIARACLAGRAVILRYHSVSTLEDGTHLCLDPGLAVSPADFDGQCAYLRGHYSVISLDEMVDRLIADRPLPPRAVALTFDDGYVDNYSRAFPILRRHGLPATFYVTTGCIDNRAVLWTGLLRFAIFTTQAPLLELGGPGDLRFPLATEAQRREAFTSLVIRMKNVPTAERLALLETVCRAGGIRDLSPLGDIMMTWQQVREMRDGGMSFGAHTITHPNLPNATPEEARAEIYGSRDELAAQLGERVRHFSYPNGRGSAYLTPEVKALVRDAGFDSSTTSTNGSVVRGDDLLALKRVGVYRRHGTLPEFTLDIERGKIGA